MDYSTKDTQDLAWRTPKPIYNTFKADAGGFGIDLFASAENALEPVFFTEEQDAIMQQWRSDKAGFGNPSYGLGKQEEALFKALTEVRTAQRIPEVWLLVQAAISTKWFYLAATTCEVNLFKGRIAFDPPPGAKVSSAKFSSALVIIRPSGVGPVGITGFRCSKTGVKLCPSQTA
jgi:phage N-6-adenine-methyltransferase